MKPHHVNSSLLRKHQRSTYNICSSQKVVGKPAAAAVTRTATPSNIYKEFHPGTFTYKNGVWSFEILKGR